MRAFRLLSKYDQDSIIEFLKLLQVLPPGTRSLCVDQDERAISCPAGIEPRIPQASVDMVSYAG
ncbi:MAG: hypothetical protein ACRD22_03895 [Terriglobia bacterium]